MAGNSTYTQISPYLLLEYQYGDSSTTYISNQVKLARIKNAYLNGQVQLLNTTPSQATTQNTLNTSAANIGGYSWAFLDTNAPVPYINLDPKLTYTDLSTVITSAYVVYDTVRVHIVSGYRLEDLQGLIIQVSGKEAMNSNYSVLANNVYLNSDSRDILNPRPILMGDRMYDRYVEFMIPSIKWINSEFFANPTNVLSLGYQYTSDNKGLLFNTSIYVKVYEISKTTTTNGILYLSTSNTYDAVVTQEETYSSLAANVQESTDGDYFLYYPTYDGNFIEEFLADLNAAGGDYILINDIEIYEQVGSESILTFSFSQQQTGGFDGPLEFRPIIKYADTAVAFSIDYTVRVFNRFNGFQIIRRASTTSFNPRKYGKSLEKIALVQQAYPFKVYNKVFSPVPYNVINNPQTTQFSTVYVPVFYETRNVVAQTKTLLANGSNPLSPDFYQNINFGQGDARIYLSDFQSVHKFVISQVDAKTGSIIALDLTAGSVSISFKDTAGNMIKIPAQASDNNNSLANGEVVFNIPDYVKLRVLGATASTSTPQPFYIVSTVPGTADTLIYSGTVDMIENVSNETARAQTVVTAAQSVSTTSSSSTTTGATASTTTGTSTSSTSTLSSQLSVTAPTADSNKSLQQSLTESNSASVASVQNTPQIKPVVIPGFSVDGGAVSIKKGLSPISNTSNVVAKTQISTKLSQQTGTSTTTTINP